MQVPLGVSQEGYGMSGPHADGHSSETGGRAVQYGLRFDGLPAGHRARGMVGAAGVGIQRILDTKKTISEWSSSGGMEIRF